MIPLVCVGMALESCVVYDWPQRYWDHQKILVMATFYVHSEFCFKVRVGHGQWTVTVQCWCWKLCGKWFYIWVCKQNSGCQSVSIYFSFSLFSFPPCFSLIMYFFWRVVIIPICPVEVACTLEYLHLFPFWYVRGGCFCSSALVILLF